MEAHALEDDQATSTNPLAYRSLGQGAIRFLVVAPLSLIVSILWMARISGGWSFEPLTWLTLLWSSSFSLSSSLLNYVERSALAPWRSSFSCSPPSSCFPSLEFDCPIGDPNSCESTATISMTEAFSKMPSKSKRHPWERIFHWKRLPDDRLVPYCLAWRLDRSGLQPIAEVPVSVLSKKNDGPNNCLRTLHGSASPKKSAGPFRRIPFAYLSPIFKR